MAHNVIPLEPVPSGESSAQAGENGYAEIAFLQCARYIIRRSEQDFDPYLDVVVEYDDENNVARAYAIRCDREAPTRWE